MANFVVTTLADTIDPNDGQLSLREAIQNANGTPEADTITFKAGITIVLADPLSGGGTDLDISGALTIDGDLDDDGVPDVTTDGNGTDRVFAIDNVDPGTREAELQ